MIANAFMLYSIGLVVIRCFRSYAAFFMIFRGFGKNFQKNLKDFRTIGIALYKPAFGSTNVCVSVRMNLGFSESNQFDV